MDGSHIRAKRGGAGTGPSPVDRRETSSKHHLICDGRGIPLKVITTAANVNDVTQTLALLDGIPPVAGRPGRPRRRPDSLLGDTGYDSHPARRELRKRRILPVISRKGAPSIKGLGKLRYVVKQTLALLHQFKPLPSVGNAEPNSTTPSSRWPAASSAGETVMSAIESEGGHGRQRLLPRNARAKDERGPGHTVAEGLAVVIHDPVVPEPGAVQQHADVGGSLGGSRHESRAERVPLSVVRDLGLGSRT
ncbi:transposase [Streptomyces luteogriseus]|uniref:transposase n=1 Tax=Streptomyces luteogriseus TaxID=68233 RepID=UPI0037911A39